MSNDPDAAEQPPPSSLERRLLDLALRLLTPRDHTVQELRVKLKAKTPAAEAGTNQNLSRSIDSVIGKLLSKGYLDDRRAAAGLARQARVSRLQGDARIVRDLKRRGIDATIVDSVLADLPDSAEALEAALRYYVSRRGAPGSREALQRCYRYLVRLGHSPSRVRQALAPYFRQQSAP